MLCGLVLIQVFLDKLASMLAAYTKKKKKAF